MTISKEKQLQQFIEKAIHKYGTMYNYANVIYVNSRTRVSIICAIHGEFTQTPSHHLTSNGCHKCTYIINGKNHRNTTDEFIVKAKQKHGDRYDYTNTIYVDTSTYATIRCMVHGLFQQTPNSHLAGNGCPICGKESTIQTRRSTTNEFIKKAYDIHGDKYIYDNTCYKNDRTKVIITCIEHGDFEQNPNAHLQGNGCTVCFNVKRKEMNILTLAEFVTKASTLHNNRYTYTNTTYINYLTKISITCSIHGDFEQTPHLHMYGSGCRRCAHVYVANAIRVTIHEFITRAHAIHNNTYLYDNVVYHTMHTPVEIICKKHGSFYQMPSSHLNGRGCGRCNSKRSIKSREWLSLIQLKHPNLHTGNHEHGEYRIPTTRYYADGYCPDTHTIYEFHGDFWHGNPAKFNSNEMNPLLNCTMGELYKRTLQKRDICLTLGYNYVEIWETQWNMFKKVIMRLQKKIHTQSP